MKNRLGIIVLILICVGLSIALVWNRKSATEQQMSDADRIDYFSNKVISTSADLDKHRQVNAELERDRSLQNEALNSLTNLYVQTAASLEKTRSDLQATQAEMTRQVAQRDARITELESENQQLDQRALDLASSITNLTVQIEDTRQKLAASEGDKAFLERELQRLIAEKTDLERRFNDLAALRAQVAKLREELNVSRRIEWIRKGLFSSDQKGAELLMRHSTIRRPERPPAYDLNVEITSDGSVRVIPPVTNSPAAQ